MQNVGFDLSDELSHENKNPPIKILVRLIESRDQNDNSANQKKNKKKERERDLFFALSLWRRKQKKERYIRKESPRVVVVVVV